MLLGTSCTNDFEPEMNDGKFSFSSISASMGDLPTTKTHLENGGRVVWDLNDQIGIFSDTQTEPIQFTCTSVDDSNASFTANEEISGNNFVAYYPYNNISADNNILTYTLPINIGDAITIPNAPMIAESTTNEFNFKHTCGFVRFSITGSHRIKNLKLTGNNNEKISGKGTIDVEAKVPILSMSSDALDYINLFFIPSIELSSEKAKDFYFIVPVGKFTKGLTLEITYVNDDSSTTVIKKSTNKSIEVSRSVIKSFSVFDTDDLIEEIANEEEKIYGALMAFYNATDGANWHNNTNWGDKNVPYGEWYGLSVSYAGDENYGKIKGISMNENNLKGSFPNEIIHLKDLEYLYLADNEIDNIPASLCELPLLEEISMGNCGLSGGLPEKLSQLKNLKMLNLPSNKLSGNIDFLGELSTTMELIDLNSNKLTGTIPATIGNLTNLYNLTLDNNNLTNSIPKEIGNIGSLKMLQLGRNSLEGKIPVEISNLKNLEVLSLAENQLEGTIPESFVKLEGLKSLFLAGNKLNGTCSETLSEFIEDLDYTLEQQEGYEISLYFYTSSDYSEDKKITTLQEHSYGNGIKIVITIDAFTDKEILDGTANNYITKAYNALFEEEPYATYKNYFDVYSVLSVSKRKKIGTETALATKYSNNNNIFKFSLNQEKIEEYAKLIPAINNSMDNTHILVLLNDKSTYRSNCGYTSYGSIACTNIRTDEDFAKTIKHEILGHGIGKLGDEYIEETDDIYNGFYPEDDKQNIWTNHQNGWYLNVDVTNDPATIAWKDFLNNDDYIDKVGIYEGALLYAKGAYRATPYSIMLRNEGGFNAPSRWAIYRQIMEAAGKEYSFESFLEYDKKNLTSTRSILLDNTSDEPIDKSKLGAPPIFLNR